MTASAIPAPDRAINPSESPPQYFYTDPLAAAWMQNRHGFRLGFYDHGGRFAEFTVPVAGSDDMWRAGEEGRFYVHPDSMRLLAPQQYDILDVTYQDSSSLLVYYSGDDEDDMADQEYTARIIQRGGVAFIAPESEAA